MSRKRIGKARVACLVIAVFALGGAVSATISLVLAFGPKNGCVTWGYPQCEIPRNFKIQVLFLSASDFPVPIRKQQEFPGLLRSSQEHSARSYYGRYEYHANHELWRYATVEQASSQFDSLMSYKFRSFVEGATHEPVEYTSPIANKFYAECESVASRSYRGCTSLTQYDEYIIFFESQISPDFVSDAEFVSLLKKIDQRMTQFLDKTGPAPARTP